MSSNDAGQHPENASEFRSVAPDMAPVFVCERDEYATFYTPHFLCVLPLHLADSTGRQIKNLLNSGKPEKAEGPSSPAVAMHAASRIVLAAQGAGNEKATMSQVFAPECLTLFLNNACNLKCRYCHAAPQAEPSRPIDDNAIWHTARLVAASCAHRQRPFTVAFHGGGEPSLDESRVNSILKIVRIVAQDYGTVLRTYIATNGVMPEKRAHWLAGRFDLVGLSCDGPPDIQDHQRPARDGQPTSSRVERTASILRQAGSPFLVRATITKTTIGRQAELMSYFIEQLAPAEVRLEPVYVNSTGVTELSRDDAPIFVAGYMEAWKMATARNVQATTSLARPASLYGRHCNVLRQVLNLVPGNIATGCFLESWEADIDRRQMRIGAINPESGCFNLHTDRIMSLLAGCSEIPDFCRDCICCFQCSYGCPDVCALKSRENRTSDLMAAFRCQASRLLMEAFIMEASDTAWHKTPPDISQDVLVSERGLRVAVYRGTNTGSNEADMCLWSVLNA